MNFEFKLPDIGEGLVEGEIVKWYVKEGDTVAEHQPLAAVLTDKAEVEIPSPKSGKIVKLFGKPGEKVKVHGPLVTFDVADNGSSTASSSPTSSQGTAKTEALKSTKSVASQPSAVAASTNVLATPMLRKLAKDRGIDIALVSGTGPQGRILEADLKNFNSGANATAAVKALAASLGADLSLVKGTGPGGRIVEEDVRAAAQAAKPTASAGYPPICIPRQPSDETLPFAGIRRKIAEKLQQSRRTVAHVTHMDECDMTAVLTLRESLKAEAAKRGVKLTFLPFIVRALVKTLLEFPRFNSALDEAAGEIVIRRHYNIGVAVAAPQGLLVPNIKDAENKGVWQLAAEVVALADKVRAHKIDVASLQGGTFTITNIGPIGGLFATPIVNHPEVAILGLMKLQKRPVVRDGKVVARDMMNLVLSFDHRVVDGADVASFMNTIIKHLENPRTLL